jgi:hypothetical protein
MRCTCWWRHYAHARAVWCSWCPLEWPGYPYDELVIARAIIGREGIWMASRFLTTKIPSTLLVAVGWLQHTWYPRFHRDTFGYGITTSPTIEAKYEYGVSMQMQVSMPEGSQMHMLCSACSKTTFILNSQSCEQDQKESVQDWGFDGIFDWHEIFGWVWDSPPNFDLITTSTINNLQRSLADRGVQPRHYMVFRLTKQCLELQRRLAAQQGT